MVAAASSASSYVASLNTQRENLPLTISKYVNDPVTFPFRRSIPHRCATFSILQEAAARDQSRPAADDDKTEQQSEATTGGTRRACFLSAPRVRAGACGAERTVAGTGN